MRLRTWHFILNVWETLGGFWAEVGIGLTLVLFGCCVCGKWTVRVPEMTDSDQEESSGSDELDSPYVLKEGLTWWQSRCGVRENRHGHWWVLAVLVWLRRSWEQDSRTRKLFEKCFQKAPRGRELSWERNTANKDAELRNYHCGLCCCCLVVMSCLTRCDPMDLLPGSSIHGSSAYFGWGLRENQGYTSETQGVRGWVPIHHTVCWPPES